MTERDNLEAEFGRPETLRKNKQARNAFDVVNSGIDLEDYQTSEEAAVLGATLVAYSCEAVLHNEDRVGIEDEVDVILYGKTNHPKRIEYYHGERLERESALIPAVRLGDYRNLKRILKKWGEAWGPNGVMLLKLVANILDKGKPFKLPPPAWTLDES